MSEITDQVKDIVETWNVRKKGDSVNGRTFTQMDMRDFCELMNAQTKRLISVCQTRDLTYYDMLFQTATAAQKLTANEYVDDPRTEALARKMISEFGVNDDEFYTGLFELAMHAPTMLQGRKLFADGIDRTNV